MKNKLSYFISSSSMFGIGFFLLFKSVGKDAWISLILGTLLGIMIIYVYSKIKDKLNNQNLKDTLKTTIGKFYLFLFIIFYIYLIVAILTVLPMFVNSFYLLYTPKIIVVIPFLILGAYITLKEKRVLETLSNLLFGISIIVILIYAFALSKYINVSNLTPILTSSPKDIFTSSLIYASITTIPLLPMLNYPKNDFKHELKVYLISSLMLFIITILTIMALGETLITIYSFPEYEVLKQIKILDFIENIENLSTFIWYFDMFIAMSTFVSHIKEILPQKYNKLSLSFILLLCLFLSIFVIGANYRLIITLFYTYPYILLVFFLIFITLLGYLKITNHQK